MSSKVKVCVCKVQDVIDVDWNILHAKQDERRDGEFLLQSTLAEKRIMIGYCFYSIDSSRV